MSERTAKVAKFTPKVTVKAAKKVKKGARPKVTVKVKIPHLTKRPTGTVRLKFGSKSVKVKLRAKHRGKVTIRLPRLSKGKYTLKATFVPKKKLAKHSTKKSSAKRVLRVR